MVVVRPTDPPAASLHSHESLHPGREEREGPKILSNYFRNVRCLDRHVHLFWDVDDLHNR